MGLGIFKGGFTRPAASKIAGASHFFLGALANKFLIFHSEPGRYALHMSFSQYLLEKLRADPLLASHIEAQHNLFYLGYLRDSEIDLQKADSVSVLNEVLADIDNIRTAWDQMVAAENYRALEHALSAWMILLRNCGWFREAINYLSELDLNIEGTAGGVSDIELFDIYIKSYLGEFHYHVGDYEAGIRALQGGLDRAKLNRRHNEEAEIYRLMGNNYSALERFAEAKEMYRQGLAIAEKHGDLHLVYQFINSLGVGAFQESDYENGVPIIERALEIARRLDDKSKIAQALNDLGNLYCAKGDYKRARDLLTETFTYLPEIEEQTLKSTILDTMGRVLTACEEYPYASHIFSQGLGLLKEIEATPLAMEMFESVSELLNKIDEKSLALGLSSLVADHPAAPAEIKAKAIRLRDDLTAENILPENLDWGADQLRRVLVDVIRILDQKA